MANLSTLSSSELQELSQRDFVLCLDDMTPQAIERFRKMRKIPDVLSETLDIYLEKHPEKRVAGPAPQAKPAPPQPTKPVANGKPAPRPAAAPKVSLQARITAPITQFVDDYIPFADRFTAWWNGEEIAPNKRVRVTPTAAAQKKRDPSHIVADTPPEGWTPHRFDIVQRVWGKGLDRPGGAMATVALAKVSGTKPGMKIADLTAGFGGGVRALAKEFETKVVGYESEREVAEAGQAQSEAEDMAQQAPIQPFDPEDDVLPQRAYDRIFARELLYTLPRRSALLDNVYASLRPEGQFVFTDFVLADREEEPPEVAAWRDSEPDAPLPWTVEEYKDSLRDARLEPKMHTDQTEIYVNAIESAWRDVMKTLTDNPLNREEVDLLMQEGRIWLNRTRALKTGRLLLVRFQSGRKRIRAMSDPLEI